MPVIPAQAGIQFLPVMLFDEAKSEKLDSSFRWNDGQEQDLGELAKVTGFNDDLRRFATSGIGAQRRGRGSSMSEI